MKARRWIGASEAAKLASVSRQSTWEAHKRGELIGVETDLGLLYLQVDVLRWNAWRQAGRPLLVGGTNDGDEG